MRNHLAAAAEELTRLEQDLQRADAKGDPVEALVRLELLARLLLGQGPVGAATSAVMQESALDVTKIERQAVHDATAAFKGRTRELLYDLHRARRLLRDEDRDSPLRQTVDWHGEKSTMVQALMSLRSADAWNALRLQELAQLTWHVFPALSEGLRAAGAALPADVAKQAPLQELSARSVALEEEVLSAHAATTRVMRYVQLSDHHHTLAALKGLVSAVDELRLNTPAVNHAAFRDAEVSLPSLLPRCERLVSAVRARLLEGPERSYAVDRLVLQLERFERVSLLKNMRAATRPEQPFQEAVDKFVFAEGFYPITHATAGRGRIDTLIEAAEQAAGMRSILLELKQAVKVATPAAVRKAVKDGSAQVEDYSKSLRSHPRWAVHEVFCIIAYAGPRRFSVNHGDAQVRLVYLGDAPPSAAAAPLFNE